MDSSSDDSFLWADASNESSIMDHEGETASVTSFKHDVNKSHEESHYNIGIEKHRKNKSKKRKISESSNISHSGNKRIKIEPESDAEARKMKNVRDNFINNDTSQSNNLNGDYLSTRIKQEEASLIEPRVKKSKKKDKHRNTNSDIENAKHSQSSVDMANDDTEKYLDMRVKQEQESFVMPDAEKSKRKKKHKSLDSVVENDSKSQLVEESISDDTESYLNMKVKQEQASALKLDMKVKKKKKHKIAYEESVTEESESQFDTIEKNNSAGAEDNNMEYTVIESKFTAEETVVNKPKKKKHKKDDKSNVLDKSSIDRKNGSIELISKEYSDGNSDNDISVQPNDFNSGNIVSSTIINNSTIDTINNRHKKVSITEDILNNEKNLHRSTKISDRIRFEDDESSSHLDLNLNKPSYKIEAFLKVNPHLQLFSPRTQYNTTITVDDEIWILRCPREINQKKLKSSNLSLEGKFKLKIDGQSYDGIPNEDINRITHVAYQNGQTSIMNLPIKGCVHYRKRIPKAHIPEDMSMVNNQTNFIPLPETKCRHPLFGANYKKAIKIPTVVAARLEAAKDKHNEIFEHTKKKKQKKEKNKSMNVKTEEDCKAEFEPPMKKSRKRKHAEDTDAAPKKSKRLKHDAHSAEAWESEKAIEENLFNF